MPKSRMTPGIRVAMIVGSLALLAAVVGVVTATADLPKALGLSIVALLVIAAAALTVPLLAQRNQR